MTQITKNWTILRVKIFNDLDNIEINYNDRNDSDITKMTLVARKYFSFSVQNDYEGI